MLRVMEKTRTIPVAALRFDALPAAFAEAAEDGPRHFAGVAYAGEVITGHGYWGRVAFDLASTRFADKVPILVEHDRGQRAGFGQLSIDSGADAGSDLRISGTLLDNAHGNAIAAEADAGFPWQLSVHIEPGSIEEVGGGELVALNGRMLSGPLTIFRNSLIRETSFTPTGADAHTHARVFASGETVSVPVISNEDHDMSELETAQQRIATLEADLAKANEQSAAAVQRAETAEASLSGLQASLRTDQTKALFAALGKPCTDEDLEKFAGFTEEQFSVVAKTLREAAKPQVPAHLFSEQVTDGHSGDQPTLDTSAIYAARKGA